MQISYGSSKEKVAKYYTENKDVLKQNAKSK